MPVETKEKERRKMKGVGEGSLADQINFGGDQASNKFIDTLVNIFKKRKPNK